MSSTEGQGSNVAIISTEGELIPGLPNDIAIRCLAKLSTGTRAIASAVSSAWRSALDHRRAFTSEVRVALGVSGDNYLFLSFLHRQDNRIVLQRYLVDLVQIKWKPIEDPLLLPHVTEGLSESARDMVSGGLLAEQLDGYANLILHLEQSSFKSFSYYPPVAAIKVKQALLRLELKSDDLPMFICHTIVANQNAETVFQVVGYAPRESLCYLPYRRCYAPLTMHVRLSFVDNISKWLLMR